LAKRVLAWLDDLNIHHCYAGGNSMGGYLALAMARQAPERIRGLWLLAPGGLRSAPLAPVLQEVLEDRHNPLVVRSHDDFKRLLDYCFVHRPWMPSPLLRFLAQRAMAHNHRAQRIFDAMLNDSTPAETLADGLSTPALVMWGRADQVLHVDGAEVVTQLMPNARAIVLDQVGHLPQLEQPKVVAESWVSFTQADARQATNSA
jgi:pimeloyl-ACP methyl ester carboxylesterase